MLHEDNSTKIHKSAKKNKNVIDANLIFSFDRKVDPSVAAEAANHVPHMSRPSRAKARHYESKLKSIFFQSNFKFVLFPDVNPMEKALSDPDTLPPWDSVLAVVQTLSEADTVPKCPICLETAKIPQFTKCGHVFCWTCILQQLHCTYSTAQSCPICTERVHRRDLRSAHFLAVTHPHEGRVYPLQLVCLATGCLFPRIPTPYTTGVENGGAWSSDAPNLQSSHAKLSRVLRTTTDQARYLLLQEKSKLLRFHDSCLATASNVSPPPSPDGITRPPSAIPTKAVWGAKPNAVATLPDQKPGPSTNGVGTSTGAVHGSKRSVSSLQQQKHLFESMSSFDVEYLPYVAEALWLLEELAVGHKLNIVSASDLLDSPTSSSSVSESTIFAKKLSNMSDILPKDALTTYIVDTQQPSKTSEGQKIASNKQPVDSANLNANITITNTNSSLDTVSSKNSHINVEVDENMYYFFQSHSGEPVFLHPLCMKCLFTSAFLDAINAPLGSLPVQAVPGARSRPSSRTGSRANSRHPSLTDSDLLQHYMGASSGLGIFSSVSLESAEVGTSRQGPPSISPLTVPAGQSQNQSYRRGRSDSWTASDAGVSIKQPSSTPRKRDGALSPTDGAESVTVPGPPCPSVPTDTAVHTSLFTDRPLPLKTMLAELRKLNIQTLAFPASVCAKVKEVETLVLTAAMKTKIPFLRHYPDGCSITLVEIQMKSIVREDALMRYEGEFSKRASDRRARARAKEFQKQEEKFERIIERGQIEAAKESLQLQEAIERSLLQDLHRGPRLGHSETDDTDDLLLALSLSASLAAGGEPASSSGGVATAGELLAPIPMQPVGQSNLSFKTVTQMSGYFPSLSSSPNGTTSIPPSTATASASAFSTPSKWAAGTLTGKQVVSAGSAWPLPGSPATIAPTPSLQPQSQPQPQWKKTATPTTLSVSAVIEPTEEAGPHIGAGKKKTKKTVPLFTNSSGRSYR